MEPPSKYLIMSGGGLRVFSYVSIINHLQTEWHEKWWKNCQGYYGVSAGTIIQLMLLLDYDINDITDLLFNFPFERIFQPSIDCFFQNWSLDNGQQLYKFLKSILNNKNLSENLTLSELFQISKQEFHIVVSNLTLAQTDIWNHITQPELPIIKAIQTSCALPFIFPFHQINQQVFIDGAYFCPYPFTLIHKDDYDKCLGIYNKDFEQQTQITNSPQNLTEFLSLCFMSSRNFILNPTKNYEFWKYTIWVHINNVHITDFELNHEQRMELWNLGITTTQKFINKNKLKKCFSNWKKIMKLNSSNEKII